MKEHLQKIAAAFAEIAKAAKDGDTATLIAKLEEAAETIDTATTEADTTDAETTTQAEDIAKMKEQIAKYADMYVSADDFTGLLEQFKEAMATLASLTPITKTVEELATRLETVEKGAKPSAQGDGEAAPVAIAKGAAALSDAASRFA
jgi:DNA repair ATPase RecN